MCICTPNIKTPFCGKIGCGWPIYQEKEPIIKSLEKRIELCEKVFIKIMQLDTRLHTLEFNSDIPTSPSSAERIMDFEMRLQRLESYLLKPETSNE